MKLRPYQQDSVDAIIGWIKKCREPCVLEAPTGAGKSVIIAETAKLIHQISKGKRVLCLAPSAELVEQNAEKYRNYGFKASIFSASAGSKCLRHNVVFGTPGTVKNRISKFGRDFAAVILDEAHGITPTVRGIIDAMRVENGNLRVIGLTATPYRLGDGYIFAQFPDGRPVPEFQTREPYFAKLVHRIRAHDLLEMGYLAQPVIGAICADRYETLSLELNSMGKFNADEVDRAYHGHGRKTAAIVADVVAQSRDRMGVMIFAATVRHAHEVMASLPPGLSAIVTGDLGKAERKTILTRFKAKELKYIVNVDVLTTGFDCTHVDVIAMLRATESVGLLQQIIGRGLRPDDDKDNCLILDYAENIERHCPDGDIFAPEVKALRRGADGEGGLTAICPSCGCENEFGGRPNPDGYHISKDGYFCDLDGNPIQTDYGPMPAHFGRRCLGMTIAGGDVVRCGYRWTSKECPHCGEPNDIAARYCCNCKGELVDPNEKLRIEFKELKRDPTRRQTDRVVAWNVVRTISSKGNETDRVDITTPYRSFSVWVMVKPAWTRAMKDRAMLDDLCGMAPLTVTYSKDADSGFYRIYAFNQPEDKLE